MVTMISIISPVRLYGQDRLYGFRGLFLLDHPVWSTDCKHSGAPS